MEKLEISLNKLNDEFFKKTINRQIGLVSCDLGFNWIKNGFAIQQD
jgi:hypothetical protein